MLVSTEVPMEETSKISPGTLRQSDSSSFYNDEAKDSLAPTIKPSMSSTSIPGYHLGHPAKHRSHMQIAPTSQIAINNANSLKKMDFAFVLRSNGVWTYSIVAYKPFSNDGPSIMFVLDSKGSTKTLRKKNWERGIRAVNTELVNVVDEGDWGNGIEIDRKENNLGPDHRETTGGQFNRGSKVPKKKNRGETSENHPPKSIVCDMSKKFFKRKANISNSQQGFASFTSDKAVIADFDKECVGSSESWTPDSVTPKNKLYRAPKDNVSKSDQPVSTLEGDLNTLRWMVKHIRENENKSEEMSASTLRYSSFHGSSSTRHHHGGQRKSKSRPKKYDMGYLSTENSLPSTLKRFRSFSSSPGTVIPTTISRR